MFWFFVVYDGFWCVDFKLIRLEFFVVVNVCYIGILVFDLGYKFVYTTDWIWFCAFILSLVYKFWCWVVSFIATFLTPCIETDNFFVRILDRLHPYIPTFGPWSWLLHIYFGLIIIIITIRHLHFYSQLFFQFVIFFFKFFNWLTLLIMLLLQYLIIIKSIWWNFICLPQINCVFFYLLL